MPLEQKLALKLNENNIGYLPMNASVQGASTLLEQPFDMEKTCECSNKRTPPHV
jgi:hypothetical protein